MGDNRDNSDDSSMHLCQPKASATDCTPDPYVPVDDVVGKVFVLLWPHEPLPRAAPPGRLRRRPGTRRLSGPRRDRLPRERPSGATPGSTATSARCAGSASSSSPASTRPVAAPAPGRWSPARRSSSPASRGRSPGWPTPSCSPRRPASGATPRSSSGRVAWSVVVIESDECDRLGMHVANVEALRRAVALLDVAAGVRPHRRLPGRRPRRARARGVEGRPGRGLHQRRVGRSPR